MLDLVRLLTEPAVFEAVIYILTKYYILSTKVVAKIINKLMAIIAKNPKLNFKKSLSKYFTLSL